MKKPLLLGLAMSLGLFSFGQSVNQNSDYKTSPKSAKIDRPLAGLNDVRENQESITPQIPYSNESRATVGEIIGTTKYDLQTNTATARRITQYGDGTLGAVWTFSTDDAFTTRGTGYNYFNGTAWGTPPANSSTDILESDRNGWPNIAPLGAGGEINISHGNNIDALIMSTRASKGTGSWVETQFSSSAAPYDTIQLWPRMATGGANNNTIHVIGRTASSLDGTSPDPVFWGLEGALAYSRSSDGGATWDMTNIQLPGLDTDNFTSIGGDSYAIDADGDVVAVVVGDIGNGVILVKSTDGGDTWNWEWALKPDVLAFDADVHLIVDTTASADWNNPASADYVDTTGAASMRAMPTSDGSVGVIIDQNGMAHVFYGYQEIVNDDLGDSGSISYFPGLNGIGYWNENMKGVNVDPMFITGAPDLNGDGFAAPSTILTDQSGYAYADYRFQGLASQPQAGIDESGCIYLVYVGIHELLESFEVPGVGEKFNYRHVWGVKSCDGGCTWTEPVDLSPYEDGDWAECVYPSIARDVTDGFAHIIFQKDLYPSTNLMEDGSGNPQQPVTTNDIVYVKVATSSFSDTPYGCVAYVEDFDTETPICGGSSLTLKASCGSAYKWNGVDGTDTYEVSASGTYELIVTTECGNDTMDIDVPVTFIDAVTITSASTDENCTMMDGTADVTVTGTSGPFTYNWSNGAATASITGLDAGDYSLTVTDNYGCEEMVTATINVSDILDGSSASTDASACGSTDGTATYTNSAGTTPYMYTWNNSETTAAISGLGAGTYMLTVTDAYGCMDTYTLDISEVGAADVTVTDVTDANCYNESTGSMTIDVSGGSAPYTYMWSDGSTATGVTTSSVTGLAMGSHRVTVTDNAGCIAIKSGAVNEPDSLELTVTGTDPLCVGSADGTAMVMATGGNSGFTYAWAAGSTTDNASGLMAGSATVSVTDSKGCETIDSVVLTDPAAITITAMSTDAKCNGNSDGTALASAAGGTGVFTYAWSNSSTASSATGLTAGNVMVTVTDGNGCVASETLTISEPTVLTVTGIAVTDNASIGTLDVTVSGGTPSYTYSWTGVNGYTSSSEDPNDIPNQGDYTVNVTDANGCTTSSTATVGGSVSVDELSNDNAINVYPNPNDGLFTLTVNGVDNYTVTLRNVVGQTVAYKTVYSNTTTFDVSSFEKGVYFLTVNDGKQETTKRVVIK